MDEVARILSYKIGELANRTGQEEPAKKSASQEVGSVSSEVAQKKKKKVTLMTDGVHFFKNLDTGH